MKKRDTSRSKRRRILYFIGPGLVIISTIVLVSGMDFIGSTMFTTWNGCGASLLPDGGELNCSGDESYEMIQRVKNGVYIAASAIVFASVVLWPYFVYKGTRSIKK